MFLINKDISGINLGKQEVRRVKYSKNIVSVSTPNDVVAPGRAYVITTQSGEGCSVYIVLLFTGKDQPPIFFEFHKNPVSEQQSISIEDDALGFVEDMGFEMQDMVIPQEGRQTIDERLNKLGIFYKPHPAGQIELMLTAESMVADGKSRLLIESKPLFDNVGEAVADGTVYEVKTSQGLILHPMSEERGNPLEIESRSGFIAFALQSSIEVGLATVQVRSKSGNARGVTRVIFIPGGPTGTIRFELSETSLIADGSGTLSIESATLTDEQGNFIADGTEFLIGCSEGSVLDPVSRQGGLETVLLSQGSKIRFLYRAGKQAGEVTIKARSQIGDAYGTVSVTLLPGPPTGKIELLPSSAVLQAGDSRDVAICTKPIVDAKNNIISDESVLTATATRGQLMGPDGQKGPKLELYPRGGILKFSYIPEKSSGPVTIEVKSADDKAQGSCTLKIATGEPFGEIVLKAEPAELQADGKDIARICTQRPITDASGNIVDDDTPLSVQVDRGKLLGLPAGDIALTSRGHISFEFLSPSSGDYATITVKGSKNKAEGSLDIPLIALEPVGQIVLSSSVMSLSANEMDETEISSEIIYNSAGNPVSDGTIIELEVTLAEFISFDGTREGKNLEIRTVDGAFRCRVRVGSKRGTMTITARTTTGTASGSLSVPVLAEAPEGSIELKTEQDAIVADGKSRVWIVSEVITDSHENPVDDDTLIALETDHGSLHGPGLIETEDGCQIPTRDGVIRFQLQSENQVGHAQVTALSVDGFAMGAIDIEFISGQPHGDIKLECDRPDSIRTDSGCVRITSQPLTDNQGNTISVEHRFVAKVEQGSLFLNPEDDGVREIEFVSQRGIVGFYFKGGSRIGPVAITIRAVEYDDCQGQLILNVKPGLPASYFTLEAESTVLYAGNEQPYKIVTTPITDAFDNCIDDGTDFLIRPRGEVLLYNDPEVEAKHDELIAQSVAGIVSFWVKREKPGQLTLNVQSFQGDANGELELDFIVLPPSGTITLRPENGSLRADGESSLEVESDAILDGAGQLIPDGTEFRLLVENGFAYYDDLEQAANEIVLTSELGRVRFHVISSLQIGTLSCTLSSQTGTAEGTCSIELVPGPPFGEIQLTANRESLMAGDPEPIALESGLIKDRHGHVVSDGTECMVRSEGGLVAAELDGDRSENLTVSVREGHVLVYAWARSDADRLIVSIDSANQEANGQIEFPIEQAPLQSDCILLVERETHPADGTTKVPVISETITDIYGRQVENGLLFHVRVEGSSGQTEEMDGPSPEFDVRTRNGAISFEIVPVRVTDTVLVSVISDNEQSRGTLTLSFQRPLPTGPIGFSEPMQREIGADASSQVHIETEDIRTDLGMSVLDDEPFTMKVTAGSLLLEGDHPEPGTEIEVKSRNGRVSCLYQVPSEPGPVTISLRSIHGDASGSLDLQLMSVDPTGTIVLESDSLELSADGKSTLTITSSPILTGRDTVVKDGTMFLVSSDKGSIAAPQGEVRETGVMIPSVEGRISFALRASKKAGQAHIQVKSLTGDASGQLAITFLPGEAARNIKLKAEPMLIEADGVSVTTITCLPITDAYGNVVAEGTLVQLETDLGTFLDEQDAVVTEKPFSLSLIDGSFQARLQASKQAGIATIIAWTKPGNAIGNLEISLTPGQPHGEITLLPSHHDIIIGEQRAVTITTLPIKDSLGNYISDKEQFYVAMIAPDGRPFELYVFPRNAKLEFELPHQTKSGTMFVTITSERGSAEGSCELNYSLVPTEDQVEEWFFAESEDDILATPEDESSPSDDEDLQMSIEDSFSRIVSPSASTNIDDFADEQTESEVIFTKATLQIFYRFMAGF
ncbi:hypothetical protein JXQ70_17795 [bacterium]|nr:hypothetical protein [bacterium]